MKVVHVIDHMGLGGAQSIVRRLVFELSQHQAFALRRESLSHDSQNIFIPSSSSRLSFPLRDLIKVLNQQSIEILHCHLFKAQLVGLIVKAFYFSKIKLIFHEHGRVLDEKLLFKLFLRISDHWVDGYIAVSKIVGDKLKNAGIKEEKIYHLSNFYNTDLPKNKNLTLPATNKRALKIEQKFVIGFVGRLELVKGIDLLLSALEYLPDDQFALVIVGTGSLEKELKIRAKNLPHRILFTGHASSDQLQKYYQQFDLLVQPSRRESFGMSVIEAQAAGVPVLVSKQPAFDEIVSHGKTGFVVKAENPKNLAIAIQSISNNPEIKTVIASAKNKSKKFSFTNYQIQLQQVYNEVLNHAE